MRTQVLRLNPGDDLRGALDAALLHDGGAAAFVVSGVGSLRRAALRFAGQAQPKRIEGDLEILTMSGTLSPDGAHLHISVSDSTGKVAGGHVALGCTVRTTAEILIAFLPEWHFARVDDPQTGYPELVPKPLKP